MRPQSRLAVLVVAALAALACLIWQASPSLATKRAKPGKSTTSSSTTIDGDPSARSGKRLDLRLETAASVRIVGWNRDVVRVQSGHKEDACRWAKAVTEKDPDGVTVRSQFSGTSEATRCTMDVEIKVPRRYDVRLALAGGDVRVSYVNGSITGSTRGPIAIDHCSGAIDLHSREGDVRMDECDFEGKVYTRAGKLIQRDCEAGVTEVPERDRPN